MNVRFEESINSDADEEEGSGNDLDHIAEFDLYIVLNQAWRQYSLQYEMLQKKIINEEECEEEAHEHGWGQPYSYNPWVTSHLAKPSRGVLSWL